MESYEILLDDLQRIHERVAASGLPVFLYGHSMGGQIALRFLQRDAPPVAGIVAASPWLRLAFAPPRWKLALARLAMCVFPRFSQGTGMRLERLTRDREHVEAMADQALMFHRISARMFFAVHAQGERVIADAGLVRAPLLLLHGDADAVTCWRATVDLHGSVASADRTLRIFPAAVHELHNDVIRTEVMEVVGSWLVARI